MSKICPKCGYIYTGNGAMSREIKDEKGKYVEICPECGHREALSAAGITGEEQNEIIERIKANDNR